MNLFKMLQLPAKTIDRLSEVLLTTAIFECQAAEERLKEAKERLAAADADKMRAINLARPSRNFPVSLTNDGLTWVARLSTSDNPRLDLVGRGDSPEAALISFDQQWYGGMK